MEYRDYDTIKRPKQGRNGGRWQKVLAEFLQSEAVRRDIYRFDGKDNARSVYAALRQTAARAPYKGKVTIVKDGQIVSINRVG